MSRSKPAQRKRKSKIKQVTVHKVAAGNYCAIRGELAKIHAGIIKRRLNETGAAPEQKVFIIDSIIAELKYSNSISHGIAVTAAKPQSAAIGGERRY
ncbi:MAG: hypothetical protein FWE74_00520 [Oscillospiraceae bacterium]|nr:hypothetical protein [Oscillospiraceae bacterium]